jgi:hypothetical protein
VTFGLQSYLSPLIVVYNIFLGAERWIVPIRIDLRQWNFEIDEVQEAEIARNCEVIAQCDRENL